MTRLRLPKLLTKLAKVGTRPAEDFPAHLGLRQVRVVEILGTYALFQPVNDPRTWEVAPVGLITVDPRDIEAKAVPTASDTQEATPNVTL